MLTPTGANRGRFGDDDHTQGGARPRPKYALAERIAQCDRSAEPSDELRVWDAAEPVGREVI